jgi:malonate transporter
VLLVGKVAVERGLRHPGVAGDLVDAGAFEPFAQEDGLGAFDHLIELAALPDLSFCVHGRPLPLATKDKPDGSVSASVSMAIICAAKEGSRGWRAPVRGPRALDSAGARLSRQAEMIEIFLKTLPFFALIALGYQACRTGFFTAEAAAYLTKFVFYFALSAMLFRFAANLSLSEIFDWWFVAAYLWGCFVVYLLATGVAILRRRPIAEAAVEAQCAVIGNTGFLGVPMLVVLLGEAAAGPVLMVLALDLIVFSTLIVILVTGSREGQVTYRTLRNVGLGLLKNPMIVSITLGLIWSSTGWTVPGPVNEFLGILGAAATPGALFAIGASLAGKSAERLSVAGWLSFCKLVLHPAGRGLRGAVAVPGGYVRCGRDDRGGFPAGGGQCLYPRAALRGRAAAGVGLDPDLHGGLDPDGFGGDRMGRGDGGDRRGRLTGCGPRTRTRYRLATGRRRHGHDLGKPVFRGDARASIDIDRTRRIPT